MVEDHFGVEPFSIKKHFVYIKILLEGRSSPLWEERFIPKNGFVIWNLDSPIFMRIPTAIGFYRKCEKHIGILDSFVTNVFEPSSERHEALQLLIETLIFEAKAKGIEHFVLYTRDDSVIKRGELNGFKLDSSKIMTRPS